MLFGGGGLLANHSFTKPDEGISLSENNSLSCFGIEDDVVHNMDPDKAKG